MTVSEVTSAGLWLDPWQQDSSLLAPRRCTVHPAKGGGVTGDVVGWRWAGHVGPAFGAVHDHRSWGLGYRLFMD